MRSVPPSARLAIVAAISFFMLFGCARDESDKPRPYTGFLPVAESEVVQDLTGGPQVVAKDEVLIFLKEDATAGEMTEIEKLIAASGPTDWVYQRQLRIYQVRTAMEEELIAALAEKDGVRFASRNPRGLSDAANQQPSSARAAAMKAAREAALAKDAPTINGSWWIEAIRADKAWDITEGDQSVTVAIVDSGLPFGQKLLDETRLSRYDINGAAVTADSVIVPSEGGHGAWMAGFAVGYALDEPNFDDWFNRGENVCGVDHKARLAFIELPQNLAAGAGMAWSTDLLTALATAADKASLINVPWSADKGGCSDSPLPDECPLIRQRQFREIAASTLGIYRNKDALVVFSSGNDGQLWDDTLFVNYGYSLETMWLERALNVGASSRSGLAGLKQAPFSRQGYVVDIYAPGEDVAFSQDDVEIFSKVTDGDGTSFASALVLGVSSLAKAVDPSLTSTEIRRLLVEKSPYIVPTDYETKPHLDAKEVVRGADKLKKAIYSQLEKATFDSYGESRNYEVTINIPEKSFNSVDLVFLIDVTGSYGDLTANAVVYCRQIMADLAGREENFKFALAAFADYPFSPYGSPDGGDQAFYMLAPLTDDPDEVSTALDDMIQGYGDDEEESQLTALYQLATGAGQDLNRDGSYTGLGEIPPSNVGWRTNSRKLVLLFTNSGFHNSAIEIDYPGPTYEETLAELTNIGITVIGMDSTFGEIDNLEQMASDTGGKVYDLTDDPTGFADIMVEDFAVEEDYAYLDCEAISGWDYISTMYPWCGNGDYVEKGTSASYQITVINPMLREPWEAIEDKLVLWFKANDIVIERHHIPVAVQKEWTSTPGKKVRAPR